MAKDPKYTAGEVTKLVWLTARMAKRGIASQTVYQGDLERKFTRIVDGAREREAQTVKDSKSSKKRK
ncbi:MULTISPECIES: DUF6257 family protein [unclassified Streptomyces]|uniref:DUF6257 family protein n=1 Tax=unclassified Streptomyces TaxID=2593676 RepID=UPI001BE94E78|nr:MULTISPECIES: DUF6257 family protein [unclassified Streptomyces]MBT2402834.1 hypothetical protein [Streptomyces sp. ISL-21]MBT2454022.1 hypothetical protein [Streptomyces sp. ISL-86]MBT2607207.1 hypothetical protein [Streptomyces sp. ISL-87]